eukprot:5452639-Pyramimonas_sp.AAC.1
MSGNANKDWAYGVATCQLRNGAVMNGFLTYEAEQSICVAGNVAVDATASTIDLLAHARLQETTTRQPLGQWIDGLEAELPFGIAALRPGLAAKIASGEWSIFKILAIGPQIQLRKSSMLSIAPSLRRVKTWLSRQPSQKFHGRPMGPKHAWPADVIVDWVSTTQYLKDVKFAHEAAECFAKLLSRKGELSQHELTQALDFVNRDTLRKARVRIDAIACLFFREFFKSLAPESLNMYIFADGSPQRRGLEMFASSFDLFAGPLQQRRYLPFISLEHGCLDSTSKAIGLLWQLFLICGPSFAMMRKACNSIRSITTDNGAERLVAKKPDFLKDFLQALGAKGRAFRGAQELRRLFPRALVVTGWRHMWDNVLKRALWSLPFFPDWLARVK